MWNVLHVSYLPYLDSTLWPTYKDDSGRHNLPADLPKEARSEAKHLFNVVLHAISTWRQAQELIRTGRLISYTHSMSVCHMCYGVSLIIIIIVIIDLCVEHISKGSIRH